MHAPVHTLGAEGVSAGRAIENLIGPHRALRVFYDPGHGDFIINFGAGAPVPKAVRPQPSPPRQPQPAAHGPFYGLVPPLGWVYLATTPKGMFDVQTALAKAGYFHAAPANEWNTSAANATRRFQLAHRLKATGKLDEQTLGRLEPFLPRVPLATRPAGPVDPELYNWLVTTRRGWAEIQTALTGAGLYRGSTTGIMDVKTQAALRAFQRAEGLKPNGTLDYATAQKLAPFLPKPN